MYDTTCIAVFLQCALDKSAVTFYRTSRRRNIVFKTDEEHKSFKYFLALPAYKSDLEAASPKMSGDCLQIGLYSF
jgi:hypothetical protein